MSPIDDELRRMLTNRSADARLEVDPIEGIERKAKSIRRRRTTGTVAGATACMALVALAVPSLRGGFMHDDRTGRLAGTPSASSAPTSVDLTVKGARPINAYPWQRDVPEAEANATVAAWRVLHPEVSAVAGQGLWSGTVDGLPGRVAVFQLWPRENSTGEDARTVFAVVDEGGTARVFHDQLTFFREQAPGEPASATKDDVQRSSFDLAVLVTSLFDQPRLRQFWVVVTPPAVTAVKLSVGAGAGLDTSSGGAGAALPERTGAITTLRGSAIAYEGPVDEHPTSLMAGDPMAWPSQGVPTINGQPAADVLYQETNAALRSRVSNLVATAVLGIANDRNGIAALVIGEYDGHGYGAHDSAYVIGTWIKPHGGSASLVGLHDSTWGLESANARVPDDSALGHGLVLAVGGPGWKVAYVATDQSPVPTPSTFEPFLAVPPRPGRIQQTIARSDDGLNFNVRPLRDGLTFPDI